MCCSSPFQKGRGSVLRPVCQISTYIVSSACAGRHKVDCRWIGGGALQQQAARASMRTLVGDFSTVCKLTAYCASTHTQAQYCTCQCTLHALQVCQFASCKMQVASCKRCIASTYLILQVPTYALPSCQYCPASPYCTHCIGRCFSIAGARVVSAPPSRRFHATG